MLNICLLLDCKKHICKNIKIIDNFICKENNIDDNIKIYFNCYIKMTKYKNFKFRSFDSYKCLIEHKNTHTLPFGDINISSNFKPGSIIEYKKRKDVLFGNLYEYNKYIESLHQIGIDYIPNIIESKGFYSDIYLKEMLDILTNNKNIIKDYYGKYNIVYKNTKKLIELLSKIKNFDNAIMIYY